MMRRNKTQTRPLQPLLAADGGMACTGRPRTMTLCLCGSNPVASRPSPDCRCSRMPPSLACDTGTSAAPPLPLLPAPTTGGATAVAALAESSADGSRPAGKASCAASKPAAALCTHSPDCGPLCAAPRFFFFTMAARRTGGHGPRAAAWAGRTAQRGERLSSGSHGRHAAEARVRTSSANKGARGKIHTVEQKHDPKRDRPWREAEGLARLKGLERTRKLHCTMPGLAHESTQRKSRRFLELDQGLLDPPARDAARRVEPARPSQMSQGVVEGTRLQPRSPINAACPATTTHCGANSDPTNPAPTPQSISP